MKFAYFVVPHVGGTYTVYKSVRMGLRKNGIDVRWLGVGPRALSSMGGAEWSNEFLHGEVVGARTDNEKEQARELIQHLEAEGYDGVLVNAACDRVHSNVIRYLNPRLKRVMTVHTITVATYAGARVLRDHVHSTVCVSPRIRDDLVRKNGFSKQNTRIIPNAIDISPFVKNERIAPSKKSVRLLFLGRIIDADKGVYWLPKIMDLLADCPVQLTIAGDGPDVDELQRRCEHLGQRVSFLGRVLPKMVPEVLSQHDILLFPSRFEGLPLSLVEAMAAGCVPVASHIKGVTDFVVRDGADGLLFRIGDVMAAASHVRSLIADPAKLAGMSAAARSNILGRFELKAMADAYTEVVRGVIDSPRAVAKPLALDTWSYPPGLRPGLRSYIPEGTKKWLRLWRERFA